MTIKPAALLSLIILFLAGCVQVPDTPSFKPSEQPPGYSQSHFDDYVQETREWLVQNRVFITSNKNREVNANAPFELTAENPGARKKGVLLVHGLGDSPYSFVDIAPMLAEQGFLVRTILLPGHGSKPGDLLWPTANDWENIVAHHTQLLGSEVDEVWLGGFSTGANLVTSQALEDDSIAGLLLFSPGFKSDSRLISLAPLMSNLMDWADIDPTDNYVRYDSLTFHAAGEYYKTSQRVLSSLKYKTFNHPVFIAISEDDSVIDVAETLDLFESRFSHPDSQLIWYGNPPGSTDSRVRVMSSRIPEQRVSNFSHMAALFSPDNPYYGRNGEYRLCNNGQDDLEVLCPTEENLWYSSFGYTEAGKIHARLTWNPHFEEMASAIKEIVVQ